MFPFFFVLPLGAHCICIVYSYVLVAHLIHYLIYQKILYGNVFIEQVNHNAARPHFRHKKVKVTRFNSDMIFGIATN